MGGTSNKLLGISVLFILLACTNCSLPSLDNAEGKTYALLYGLSTYLGGFNLNYPAADAAGLGDALAPGGYTVILRTDAAATKNAIRTDIQNMVATVTNKDLLVFFFAGHGYEGATDTYMLPYDANIADTGTLISETELANWLSGLKTEKVVLMFDHCFSGGQIAKNTRYVVLTASKADEVAWEFGDPLFHGLFSYYAILGLNGKRADCNCDGMVTASELFNYIDRNVNSFNIVNNMQYPQHPQFLGGWNVELTLLK